MHTFFKQMRNERNVVQTRLTSILGLFLLHKESCQIFPFDVFLGPENVPLLSLSLPPRLALRSLLSKLHKAEVT